MITWLRNSDDDEAEFLDLVASECGGAVQREPGARAGVVRVAVRDGQVAGFYGLDPDLGRLRFLTVGERWRGSGVGRLLVQDCHRLACLSGWPDVHIAAHPAAGGFFARCGAVRVGTAPPGPSCPWSTPRYVLPTAVAVPA